MTGTDRHLFSIHAPRRRRLNCTEVFTATTAFQSTPHKGRQAVLYLVSSRTAAANPTAKACFCQSSHSCNRASSVSGAACPTVCAGLPAQITPALTCIAPHTGLLILVSSFPLDFCRPVCYHRFSSVSALCWVVSAAVW